MPVNPTDHADQALHTQADTTTTSAGACNSDFLTTVCHELRTPLSGVLGMADLTLGTTLSEQQRDFLLALRRSGRQLLGMVNDLQDLAAAESGRLALRDAPFRLRRSLESLLRNMGSAAWDKGLEFQAQISPGVPDSLLGDVDRLRQVIQNLLENALTYTREGRVRLTLEECDEDQCQPLDADEDQGQAVFLHVKVEDTGSGLDASRKDSLFQSFAPNGDPLTRKSSGLGLPLCKHLAERMGGRIWFDSTPGKGSVFHCTMRLERREGVPARDANGDVVLRPLNILLAEDDAVGQVYESFLLENMGHTVRLAENGREALEALKEDDFDLVLMDIQMPEMDGLTATREIRQGHKGVRNPAIPIVALTVFSLEEDRERLLAAGVDGLTAKPLEADKLVQAMASALNKRA